MVFEGSSKKARLNDLTGFEIGLAGASSGIITRFFLQPLDVLKIRFQLQIKPIKRNEKSKYSSLYQAVRSITKEEGVSALWKGHIPGQYLSMVYGAVQFSTYEIVSEYLKQFRSYKYPVTENFIAVGSGAIAGLTAVVISFPFDIVRTHLVFQGEPKVYKGVIDAASQIYQKEGLGGFRKGLLAACVQTMPMSGLLFGFHSMFSQFWLVFIQNEFSSNMSVSGNLVTGFLAGLCAKTIVYPSDLIKKRLQIQNFDEKRSYSKESIKCSGIFQCLVVTVKHEGLLGLFKGFIPSLIKAGATSSLYFTVFDRTCEFLEYSKR